MLQVQAHDYHGNYISETIDAPDMAAAAMIASNMFAGIPWSDGGAYIVEVWDDNDQIAYWGSAEEANAAAIAALTN